MNMQGAPAYPLDRNSFREAVELGLGRAYVHVSRFGAHDVRDEILEAATTCKVYDAQSEGLSADWLADLCMAADLVPEIVRRPPTGDYWDRELRSALLKEFASRGYPDARVALYASCVQSEHYMDFHGCREIIELDGEAGLLFVARTQGMHATDHPEFWIGEGEIACFDEVHGDGAGLAVLRGHAPRDPGIAAYVRRLEQTITREGAGPPVRTHSVEEIAESIAKDDRVRIGLRFAGRRATTEELRPILGLLDASAAPQVLENSLRYLSGADAPPTHPIMFSLLRHAEAGVRHHAAETLAHHVDARIREEGLAMLGADADLGLTLLRRSARAEDAAAILAALQPSADADANHAIARDVVELLERNLFVREPRLALFVYAHSPCKVCRGEAVMWLLQRNACPDWLRDEARHDALQQTREACSGRLPSAP